MSIVGLGSSVREQFLLPDGAYLLNHSVGCPPRSAKHAWLDKFMTPWATAGEEIWPHWMDAIGEFRAALAALLSTKSDNIAPQVNLSSALTKILFALPQQGERDRVVFSEQDFPSMGFVLQQSPRRQWRADLIDQSRRLRDIETWVDAIDERTAVVFITHVQSNTGAQLPVEEICAHARAMGAVTIVDVAQSVGVVPIDVNAWAADFIIGSCVKWLCGGPGAGFLWLDEGQINRCEPLDVGWFSHENPFEFDIHRFRLAPSADRFLGGTPSVQPFAIAANSIETLRALGIENVRAHNVALVDAMIAALPEMAVKTPRAIAERGGTLVIDPTIDLPPDFAQSLKRRGLMFDERATGLRLSPHCYNTLEDIEPFLQALR